MKYSNPLCYTAVKSVSGPHHKLTYQELSLECMGKPYVRSPITSGGWSATPPQNLLRTAAHRRPKVGRIPTLFPQHPPLRPPVAGASGLTRPSADRARARPRPARVEDGVHRMGGRATRWREEGGKRPKVGEGSRRSVGARAKEATGGVGGTHRRVHGGGSRYICPCLGFAA